MKSITIEFDQAVARLKIGGTSVTEGDVAGRLALGGEPLDAGAAPAIAAEGWTAAQAMGGSRGAARPTVESEAVDAGAYAGMAPGMAPGVGDSRGEVSGAPSVEGGVLDGGAYAGSSREMGSLELPPQAADARGVATESSATPIVVDTFDLASGGGGEGGGAAPPGR